MANERTVPRVRQLDDGNGVCDCEWTELLTAARVWRLHGAPYRVIAHMLADDYSVTVDERTVRCLLNGTDVPVGSSD